MPSPNVDVLLRTHSTPDICARLARIVKLAPVRRLLIVTDVARDDCDTPSLLASTSFDLPLETVLVHNLGWASSLNVALDRLDHLGNASDSILILSSEVTIDHPQLDSICRASVQPGSSCGYALFSGRHEPSYQIPRNTCAVWSRRTFETFHRFDPWCDSQGGMEDYDLALRAFHRCGWLPRLGSVGLPLMVRQNTNQHEKANRELEAIKKIETRYPATTVAAFRKHLQAEIEAVVHR